MANNVEGPHDRKERLRRRKERDRLRRERETNEERQARFVCFPRDHTNCVS